MIKVFIILGIALLVAWIFKQPAVKGKWGEWLVALCLKLGLDKNTYRVLNNVMIPDDVGGTTQIDHIVLAPYGIFVIETKKAGSLAIKTLRNGRSRFSNAKISFKIRSVRIINTSCVWLI